MVKFIVTAVVAVVFSFTLSYPAAAQDKSAKPATEQGKEMKQDVKKDMKMEGLKSVSCDPACGFRVVSHSEAEIIDIVKTHSKKMHNMDVTDADVKKLMKDASTKGMKTGMEGEKPRKY